MLRMRRVSWVLPNVVVACWLLSAPACTNQPDSASEGDEPTFAQAPGPLYGVPAEYWCAPNCGSDPAYAPPMITACWEWMFQPDLPTERAWVEDMIRKTWNRFARINFVGFGWCSWDQPGVHVGWNTGVCYGNNQPAGKTGHNGVNFGLHVPDCTGGCETVASTACPSTPRECCTKKVAQHEFAHALGFHHEEDRQGYSGPDCNGQPGSQPGTKYGAYDAFSTMAECIDPMGYLPYALPGDIAAIQRAYGRRIRGSFVSMNGRCVASYGSATGQDGFMWDCDEFENDQEWDYTVNTQKLNVYGNSSLCLGVMAGSPTQPVELISCGDSGQGITWQFRNMYIRGYGKCMDLANGNTNGGTVQSWDCGAAGGQNQKWRLTTSGELRFGQTSSCLTVPAGGSGTVRVYSCTGASNQKFTFGNSNQQIVSQAFPTKCLDVQSVVDADYTPGGIGLPANGAVVQLYDCLSAQYNQKWNFSGEVFNNLHGRCLERSDPGNGASLKVQPCVGSENQMWDYYPL